jgi:hypothetical protein
MSQRLGRLGFRRHRCGVQVKRHTERPDSDLIPVGELDPRTDAHSAVKCAVLAPKVFQHDGFRGDDETRVTAGDRRMIEPDLHVGIATDDVLSCGDQETPLSPLEPAGWLSALHITRSGGFGDGSAERVAEPMRRSNESRRTRFIIQGLADLGDKIREIRLGDEGIGPQSFLQDFFGQHFWPLFDEFLQKFECLRREVNRAASARQLPGVVVKHERAKLDRHNATRAG